MAVQKTDFSFRDTFDKEKLNLEYSFKYNPVEKNYKIDTLKKQLTLIPDNNTLNDPCTSTFIGIRQKHFCCRVYAEIIYEPKNSKDEAGITAFRSDDAHYDICICTEKKKKYIAVKKKVGDIYFTVYKKPFFGDKVILSVGADMDNYYFYFGSDKDNMVYACLGQTRYLSSEICKGAFTGAFIGMYVNGTEKAVFKSFEYEHK